MDEMLMNEMNPWDIYGIANGEMNTNAREEKKPEMPVNPDAVAPWDGARKLTEEKRESWNRWNTVREAFLGNDPISFVSDKYLHDQIDLAAARLGEKEGMREKKRRALAQYYAMMNRTDPGEVYGALDTWMAHYNNDKKTDVDAAFESVRRWYAGEEEPIAGRFGAAVLTGTAAMEERFVNLGRGIVSLMQESVKNDVQNQLDRYDWKHGEPDAEEKAQREKIMKSFEDAHAWTEKIFTDYLREDLGHVRERLAKAEKLPEDWVTNSDGFANWMANFGIAVTEFFPDLMGQTATTLAAGPAATGTTYAINSYYDIEDNHPDMTREQQIAYSIGIGVINTLGEEVPYGIMKGKLDKVLLQRGIKKGLMRYLAYTGIAGSFEGAEEGTQQLAENLTGIVTGYFGDTKNWTAKDYKEHMFAGVPESMLTAFGSSGFHSNIGWIQNRNKQKVSMRLQGFVDARLAEMDKKMQGGAELTAEESQEYMELTALKDAGTEQLYEGASAVLKRYIERSIDNMQNAGKKAETTVEENAGERTEAEPAETEAEENAGEINDAEAQETEAEENAGEINEAEEQEKPDGNLDEDEAAEMAAFRIKLNQKLKHNPDDTVEEVKRIAPEYNADIVIVNGFEDHPELLNLIVESKLDAIREEGREPTEADRKVAFEEANKRVDALIGADGRIYVNADVMRPSAVRARMNHEILVHKGLDDMFRDRKRGAEMRAKLLTAVWNGAFGKMSMDDIIARYGAIYGKKDKAGNIVLDDAGKRAIAEEWLAKLGETNGVPIMEIFASHQLEITGWAMQHGIDAMELRMAPAQITMEWMTETGYKPERPGWVKQLFAQIKMYLRQAGLWRGPMSDDEVQTLLIRIGQREMRKRGEAENVTEEIPTGDDGEQLTTHEQELYGLPEERFSIADDDYKPKRTYHEATGKYLYKTMRLIDGKLHYPMADSGTSVPVQHWLIAEDMSRPDPKTGKMTTTLEFGSSEVDKKGNIKRNKSGKAAPYPGFHCGSIPYMAHIGIGGFQGQKHFYNGDYVWVEVDVSFGEEEVEEYRKRTKGRGKKTEGMDYEFDEGMLGQIPVEGMYWRKTNPNMEGKWGVAGSMFINRVIGDKEHEEMLKAHPDLFVMKRQGGGVFNPETMTIEGQDLLNWDFFAENRKQIDAHEEWMKNHYPGGYNPDAERHSMDIREQRKKLENEISALWEVIRHMKKNQQQEKDELTRERNAKKEMLEQFIAEIKKEDEEAKAAEKAAEEEEERRIKEAKALLKEQKRAEKAAERERIRAEKAAAKARYSILPVEAVMGSEFDGLDWAEKIRDNYKMAKAALGRGVDVYKVNHDYGIFYSDVEKRYLFSIPDGDLTKTPDEMKEAGTIALKDFYDAPLLYSFVDPETKVHFGKLDGYYAYTDDSGEIYIDAGKIERNLAKEYRIVGLKNLDKKKLNELCLRAVLVHELEHVIQDKYRMSSDSDDDSLKKMIAFIKEYFPKIKDQRDKKEYYYWHIFSEVLANIAEEYSIENELAKDAGQKGDEPIDYQKYWKQMLFGINEREMRAMYLIEKMLWRAGVSKEKIRAVVQKYQQDQKTAVYHGGHEWKMANPVTGELDGKKPKTIDYGKVKFSADDLQKIQHVMDVIEKYEIGMDSNTGIMWANEPKVRYSISEEDPAALIGAGWTHGKAAKRVMRYMAFGVPHRMAEYLAGCDDEEMTARPMSCEYFDRRIPFGMEPPDGTTRISNTWTPYSYEADGVEFRKGDWAMGRWDKEKGKWIIVETEAPEDADRDYYAELNRDTNQYLEDKYHFGPGMDNYVLGRDGKVVARVNEMGKGATEDKVNALVTDRTGKKEYRFIPFNRMTLFAGDDGVFDIFYKAGEFLFVPRYALNGDEQNFVDLVKPEVKVGKIDGAALADAVRAKYGIEMTPEDAERYGKIAQGQRAQAARKEAWREAWEMYSRDNQLFGFAENFVGGPLSIKPSFRFAGQEFTGSFIDPAWRKYSLKREQAPNESGYHYMKYLEERENALNHGPGQKSDEIAEAYARQMGLDTLTVEDDLVEMLRQLKTQDIWDYRRKKKEEDALMNAKLREEAAEVLRAEKKAQIEEEVMNILKDGVDLTADYLNENPAVFKELHRQIFGREAHGLDVGDKMVAAMNAVIRTMHPERIREIGDLYNAGYQAAFEEFRAKLAELRREYASGSKDAAGMQKKAIDLMNRLMPDGSAFRAFGPDLAELAQKKTEEARQEAFDALVKRVVEYAKFTAAAKLKKDLKKRLDQLGRRVDVSLKAVGVRDEETQVKIDRIRRYAEMDAMEAAAEVEALQVKSEAQQNAGEDSIETDESIHYLMLFADFMNKRDPQELNQALQELNKLARTGKSGIEEKLAERRSKDNANLLELTEAVNDNQFLSQSERKDVEDARAGWSFWKKTLNSEYWKSLNLWTKLNVLGNLTREKMTGANMFYQLEQETHKADQQKTTLNTANQKALVAKMDSLWHFGKGVKGAAARAEKINELREVKENTGVFRFYPITEQEGGGKQVKFERVSVDEAKQMLKTYDSGSKYQRGSGTLKSFQAEAIRHQLQTIDKRAKTQYSAVVDGVTEKLMRAIRAEERIEAEENDETVPRKRDYVLIPTPVYGATHQEMKLSQMEALYLLLCWEQPDVRYKMEFNGFTVMTIAQLKQFLDPKVIELGKWMREQLAADREEINRAYMDLYFTKINDEENYFPTYYGARLNKMTGQQQADLGKADEGGKPTPYSPGALKMRVFHLAEPKIADAMILFTNHRQQMNHFVSHARINRELRALFGNPEAMTAIIDTYGTAAYNSIKKSVQDFMNGGDVSFERSAILQKIYGAFVRSKMAFNLTSGLKQTLGGISYLAEIPAKDLIKGIADGLRNPKEVMATLGDTDYFRNRWGLGANRELRMLLDKSGNQTNKLAVYLDIADNLGSWPLRAGDAFATLFGGWAIYKYNLGKILASGMDADEAKRMAILEWEMTVERTQQSSAPHMLTETQSGPWRQLFTLFKSNQILMWNEIAPHLYPDLTRDGRKLGKKDGWKGARPGFTALVASSIAMTAFTQMLLRGVNFDKWEWGDFGIETLSDLLSGWGPAGNMMATVLKSLCEEFQYKSGPEEDISKAGHAAIRMFTRDIPEGEEKQIYSDVVKILTAAGYFLEPAAPVGAAAREGRKLWNAAASWTGADEEEKPGKLE